MICGTAFFPVKRRREGGLFPFLVMSRTQGCVTSDAVVVFCLVWFGFRVCLVKGRGEEWGPGMKDVLLLKTKKNLSRSVWVLFMCGCVSWEGGRGGDGCVIAVSNFW